MLACAGAARAFVASKTRVALTEIGVGALAIHLLLVGVIELLTWNGVVLAHMHGHLLSTLCALHVVLLVPRQLVWVDHGQHLGEALSDASNSLGRVTEGKLVPRHEFNSLTMHID